MNRMWMVVLAAAVPLVLMGAMFLGFWVRPSWADTAEPLTCLGVLVGAFLTGLCVLAVVIAGWWHGAYNLRRGDILAATALASLDVLVPTTLLVLLLLLLRGMKEGRGLLLF